VSKRKAPVRRCSWHHCSKPAVATIRFVLPNLLAGSERDYCQPHTELVAQAKGARVVRRFGPASRLCPACPTPALLLRPGSGGRTRRKGVMP
jgi:hypothetical protein